VDKKKGLSAKSGGWLGEKIKRVASSQPGKRTLSGLYTSANRKKKEG